MEPHSLHLISAEATRYYVSLEMQIIGEQGTYLCTNVYGPQRLEEKLRLLDHLSQLKLRHIGVKGICGGNFNMITSLNENKGGVRKLNRDAKALKDLIRSANLVHIHPRSGIFTWNNKRGGDRKISS